jgi:hypothetical protein
MNYCKDFFCHFKAYKCLYHIICWLVRVIGLWIWLAPLSLFCYFGAGVYELGQQNIINFDSILPSDLQSQEFGTFWVIRIFI